MDPENDPLVSKRWISRELDVTANTVNSLVVRGLLPPPLKLGTTKQARCRWRKSVAMKAIRAILVKPSLRNGKIKMSRVR